MTSIKERVPFLDLFRCVCILAVITIHVTSDPVVKLSPYPRVHFIYFAVNGACAFAVPAFIFLSAFVLFYNYQGRWNRETGRLFFARRLTYIIVPYLIWSCAYYTGIQISLGESILAGSADFFNRLLTGKNYAHLYYIVIMVQFYMLFPLLMGLLQRYPQVGRHLITIGLLLQTGFFLLNRYVLQLPATGSLAFSYLLVYLTGAYLGLNYQAAQAWLNRRGQVWLLLWLAIGALYIYRAWLGTQDPDFARLWQPYAHFILYQTYALTSCLVLFRLADSLYRRWGSRLELLSRWGQASFFIYLAHPAVLLFWRQHVVVTSQYGYQLTTILGGVAALLLPWLVHRLLSKAPYAWLVMGQTPAAPVAVSQQKSDGGDQASLPGARIACLLRAAGSGRSDA